jgi:hypothetical protein
LPIVLFLEDGYIDFMTIIFGIQVNLDVGKAVPIVILIQVDVINAQLI